MRSVFILGPLFFLLTACGGPMPYQPPAVDLRGVDQAKYNADQVECIERAKNGPPIQLGAPVTRCMKEKGYNILSPGA